MENHYRYINIINQIKCSTSVESDKSLDALRRKCGKEEASCCLNLTPHKRLSLLLKSGLIEDLKEYSVALTIINNYNTLGHEEHIGTALQQLVKHCLIDEHSEERHHFTELIWECPGLRNFHIDVIENFLLLKKNNLEHDIFTAFELVLKKTESPFSVWKVDKFERIVFWSSSSAKVFAIVTSILNTLIQRVMLLTGQCELCLELVQQFLSSVKTQCAETKKDFVMLYPREFHALVSLLDISPKIYPKEPENSGSVSVYTVVKVIEQLLKTQPVQAFCLLTHYPEWASILRASN